MAVKKTPGTAKRPGRAPVVKPSVKKGEPATRSRMIIALGMTVLLVITFFLFRRSLDGQFTNWDDPTYVLDNRYVKNLNAETVIHFFAHPSASNYHPLTMISLAVDYHFSSKNPQPGKTDPVPDARIFFRTNLVLHLLNVLLVFLFIYFLMGKRIPAAFVTALLFAVHPIHVESVSWVSERKDVLYTLFFLAGLTAWVFYARKGGTGLYLAALLFFILSLLSKPAAVVFPLAALAVDYFLKRKFSARVFLEKIPMIALSVLFGLITFLIQSKDAIADFSTFSVFHRFLFAAYGFVMYLYRIILPFGLSAFYPYPFLDPVTGYLPVIYYLVPVITMVITALAIWFTRVNRIWGFALAFYFFTVVLVLQFVSVGSAIMADRYAYVPSIALFFIAGYWFDRFLQNGKGIRKTAGYILGLFICAWTVLLAVLTYQRTYVWLDTEKLWTDVIEKYPLAETARKNRGNYYAQRDRTEEALKDYDVLVQLHSKDPKIYSNLGNIYGLRGEYEKSIEAYGRSISLDSTAFETYMNRGITYAKAKNFSKAIPDFEKAARLNPESIEIYQNLAISLTDNNQPARARVIYDRLIGRMPRYSEYHLRRGVCHYMEGNYPSALADFDRCIELDPLNGQAYMNRSVILESQGLYGRALENALKARSLGVNVSEDYVSGLRSRK